MRASGIASHFLFRMAQSLFILYSRRGHFHQGVPVSKPFAIIPFTFQNAPESFHRTIVDTFCYSGHALCHSGCFKFGMEISVGVLKSSI